VRPIRVLVVDDSALVRRTVRALVELDGRCEVVGQSCDGVEALDAVARLEPDVVTLDLDMPVMDGMTVLPRLINEFRQRVLILSTLATASSYPTFKALALGAIDFVTKPGAGSYLHDLDELGDELRRKLAVVAKVPRERIGRGMPRQGSAIPARREVVPTPPTAFPFRRPEFVVGIGGSTGATTALETILAMLPNSFPAACLVVQHLPVGFSQAFARYLATFCPLAVKEAEESEPLRAGTVYLAPGSGHLRVQDTSGELRVRIDPASAPLHGYRPAVDALFYSLALAARRRAAGVLLSGMGGDGGHGLAALRGLGGRTLAQDYDSCVIPEMPMRAGELGAVEQLVPVREIADALRRLAGGREAAWTQAS
jgi:two-component system, chemotaxis family, protein-glutamate methylesterase/glutaminase